MAVAKAITRLSGHANLPKGCRIIKRVNSSRQRPYTRDRERGRGGVNHPMAAQITPRNPRDFTGKAWGR